MKSNYKTIVSLCMSLILACPFSMADDPMSAAQDAVNASLEEAHARASNAIVEDFNFALSQVIGELQTSSDVRAVRSKIFSKQEDLQKAFEDISNLDENKISQMKSAYLAAFDEYQRFVRERFDASFIAPEARRDARKSIILASRALRAFENRCDSGRGTGGDGLPPFMYPDPPKAQYSIYVGYGSDGSQLNTNYTGTGTDKERDRNTVAEVALSGSSLITSIALSGGQGASVAFCQAAMPWALGAGAAVAIAVMYLNHRDRVKMENKIVEAKVYAFHETANDEDVARFYRESCGMYRGQIALVRRVLDGALSYSNDLQKISVEGEAFDKDLTIFHELIEQRKAITLEIDTLVEQRDQTSDETAREQVNSKLEQKLNELKKIGQEIADQANPDHIASMMLRFLVAKQADVENQLGDISWDLVERSQKRAFQKLLKIVNLIQKKSFAKFLGENSEISREVVALTEFLELKTKFKNVLSLQIKEIFGRISESDVRAAEDTLFTEARRFYEKHAHHRDVSDFMRQVRALTKDS